MVNATKEKNTSTAVNEELRRMQAPGRQRGPSKRPLSRVALGIVEIAAGVAAMVFSFFAGAVVSLFLGTVILLSGILEIVNGAVQRSTGHIVIGILGALAGIFMLANPLISLAVVSLLAGVYLVVSGAVSMYRSRRTSGSAAGGIIEMLLGLLVLFSSFSAGFLVGLYLIIRGIVTYSSNPAPAA